MATDLCRSRVFGGEEGKPHCRATRREGSRALGAAPLGRYEKFARGGKGKDRVKSRRRYTKSRVPTSGDKKNVQDSISTLLVKENVLVNVSKLLY